MIKKFIRTLFGTATEHEASKSADSEDLVALSRVSLALETNMGYEPAKEGGLAFSDIDSHDFDKALEEVKGVIHKDDERENANLNIEDIHGTQWIVIEDDSVESLAANLQYGASAMNSVDYCSRLLAAVLPFEKENDNTAYIIYSFRRGKFYPFVPIDGSNRDTKTERKISVILDDEIDVEDDRNYWYPLWPRKKDLHPWE